MNKYKMFLTDLIGNREVTRDMWLFNIEIIGTKGKAIFADYVDFRGFVPDNIYDEINKRFLRLCKEVDAVSTKSLWK